MPKHTVFKLNDKPLHQKGHILRISKAYTNQNFTKPTVLTDDVFTYITFFYASHSKSMKFVDNTLKKKYGNANQYKYDFYWRQAKIFYQAAKMLPFEASPVAAYYCMLNAAKSYLSYSSEKADDFVTEFGLHGIQEDNSDTGENLANILVKHKQKGVFPLFAKALDADFETVWEHGKKSFSLKSLLYNLPFVHRAYVMTYSTRNKKVDELFLPLDAGDMPKYYKGNDGKAYLSVDLSKKYFFSNAQTLPNTVLASINSDFTILNGNGFRLIDKYGAKYNSSSVSSEIRSNTNRYRKQFAYICGPRRLWYMKRSNLVKDLNSDAELINLNTMTINMAVMHRVSEIARYKPEQLSRLMKSNENWLLHEYISKALDQFIDELAAEITKQDIMCTGYKM